MFEISKEFEFSAAHQLSHLPPEHQCSRLHGHNYKVTVILRCLNLDDRGFIQDYGELKPIKDWIDQNLDHRNLNQVFTNLTVPYPTTAEQLAYFLYKKFKGQFPFLYKIIVSETPKTTASYWEDKEAQELEQENINVKRALLETLARFERQRR